jgi:hypothetical protein
MPGLLICTTCPVRHQPAWVPPPYWLPEEFNTQKSHKSNYFSVYYLIEGSIIGFALLRD